MTSVLTLAYGPDPDQVGDLYLPDAHRPPVAVLVHGGFWRSYWRRDLMEPLARMLVERGVAVWNLEYRRVGSGGGNPSTLRDVAHAVDHVDLLAARHGLDAGRVTLVGHSAGGHLAAWAAGPRWDPAPRMARMVVALAPVLDLVAAEERVLGGHAAAEMVGCRLDEAPDLFRQLSPAHRLPLGVPMVLVHGTDDDRVPHDLSEAYVAAARAAGDQADLVSLPGGDHFVVIDPDQPFWSELVELMVSESV